MLCADFINAVNNCLSGSYIMAKNHGLRNGPSCTANGFIEQLSVQVRSAALRLRYGSQA